MNQLISIIFFVSIQLLQTLTNARNKLTTVTLPPAATTPWDHLDAFVKPVMLETDRIAQV